MEIAGKVIVVTGAAGGVGAEAARRFARDGATLVLTDLADTSLAEVAAEIDAVHLAGDIRREEVVEAVAALARDRHGRIDIWFSNAGIAGAADHGELRGTEVWQQAWELHVMAHVHAARAVLPEMIERSEGYLIQTASAVALSMLLDKAHYTVTKHAALSFCEWLAANYRPKGVRVSCFCPGAMDTPMLRGSGMTDDHPALARALKPDAVADLLVRGIASEAFLISHEGPVAGAPEFAMRAIDYDGWIDLMARQQALS